MNSYQLFINISNKITKKINKCSQCKRNMIERKKGLCSVHAREEKDLYASYGFKEIK